MSKTSFSHQWFTLPLPPLGRQGEWLLLFNYLIPYTELLDQSVQAFNGEGGGARVNIKTEQVGFVALAASRQSSGTTWVPGAKAEPLVSVVQVCKFLVSLSKDFSSYYNRVHVLGVSSSHIHIQSQIQGCVSFQSLQSLSQFTEHRGDLDMRPLADFPVCILSRHCTLVYPTMLCVLLLLLFLTELY